MSYVFDDGAWHAVDEENPSLTDCGLEVGIRQPFEDVPEGEKVHTQTKKEKAEAAKAEAEAEAAPTP